MKPFKRSATQSRVKAEISDAVISAVSKTNRRIIVAASGDNSDLLTDDGCWKIACAYFDNPANFDENAIGNAQNVVKMLASRNEKMTELGNMSIEDYYTNLLGKVAAGGSNIKAMVETQTDVVDSIYDKILSKNSVDLNEELVGM